VAIAAFYEIRPARRSKQTPTYPEFFLFHVGEYWGSHEPYDFFPPRKEVELGADPRDLLAAINDRGITRLVIPDVKSVPFEHDWKEPASALDRVLSSFAYAAGGRTNDADIAISARDRRAQVNTNTTLRVDRPEQVSPTCRWCGPDGRKTAASPTWRQS
jgi:hypothetical protein